MVRILNPLFLFIFWITLESTESLSHSIKRVPNFRTFKNVFFITQGGGTSHHLWVFEILEELHTRGHNVSFYSTGDQISMSKDYSMIQTYELGGPKGFLDGLAKGDNLHHLEQHKFTVPTLKHSMKDYELVFPEIQKLYAESKPDVVLCDSFYLACADAAMIMKIPLIMTSTFLPYRDAMQPFVYTKISVANYPSTKEDSIFKKLFKKIYVPLYVWRHTRSLKRIFAFQKSLGLKPAMSASADRYKRVTKIANNVYGLEPSRETSQLVHAIGPIMKKSYPSLDNSTALFLEGHTRTVYVAFGQFATPTREDKEILLSNLLKLRYEGYIDGIIWSRLNFDNLPERIRIPLVNGSYITTTPTKLQNDPHLFTPTWAPQYAILQHTSTRLFVSHGGCGSLHESLYSGTAVFSYPFFGDQPINSRMIKRLGVGDFMDATHMSFSKEDHQVLYAKLVLLLVDPSGKISDRLKSFSSYLQVHAERGATRGADLVEEALFSSDERGYLSHRQDLKYEMHWLKRYDIDMYSALVVLCVFVSVLGDQILKYYSSSPVHKIKVK
ncbi:glycosyltransferase family 1 protein [Backusella circina FSU 941]|nr:glycosyltransferase family 1 protein [Backusella circina FSU 941]